MGYVLMDDAGLTGLICLINDEVSQSRQMMQNAHWIGKAYLAAVLLITPECYRCGEIITPAHLFRSSSKCMLYKLIEVYVYPIFCKELRFLVTQMSL